MMPSVRPLLRAGRAHIRPVWTDMNPPVRPSPPGCRDGSVDQQDRLAGAGHFENMNHRQRDRAFGEDACLTRTGHEPASRASLNTIALAVIIGRGDDWSLQKTRQHVAPD